MQKSSVTLLHLQDDCERTAGLFLWNGFTVGRLRMIKITGGKMTSES